MTNKRTLMPLALALSGHDIKLIYNTDVRVMMGGYVGVMSYHISVTICAYPKFSQIFALDAGTCTTERTPPNSLFTSQWIMIHTGSGNIKTRKSSIK